MAAVAVVVLVALNLGGQHTWPTLREELKKHGFAADDFADADRQITSYAVQSDPDWFGIAYYWHDGTGALPDKLRIRAFERRTATWRDTTIGIDGRKGGAALKLTRHAGFIYLDTHLNPSAGHLKVLNDELVVTYTLGGGSSLPLPDGRMVYEHGMVHFAPFHFASASLFDPRSGLTVPLLRGIPEGDLIKSPRNRSIDATVRLDDGRVRFQVTDEDLEWVDGHTRPVGPARTSEIVCRLDPRPTCESTRKESR